jgi:hypothetical protein
MKTHTPDEEYSFVINPKDSDRYEEYLSAGMSADEAYNRADLDEEERGWEDECYYSGEW